MALHAPLLRLPYFWDEAGYYVPAARDLLLTGSPIPHSTVSNAHPPLVLAYLALWWKLAGFAPIVTRTAMLLASSFTLLGLFRLAETLANFEVAVTTTVLTALYPVFFAQSSLVHLDLAAAGLTFWGLNAYVKGRGWRRRALVLARQLDQGDRDPGARGPVCLGVAIAAVAEPGRKDLPERKIPAIRLASGPTASPGRLVRLPLLEDRFCLRQSGVLSLQRRGHAAASSNSARLAGSPVADRSAIFIC